MTRSGRREPPIERRIHPRGAGPPAITLPARVRSPKDLGATAPHRMWRRTTARARRPKDRAPMTHRSPDGSATRAHRRANSTARVATRIDVARGSVADPFAVSPELAAGVLPASDWHDRAPHAHRTRHFETHAVGRRAAQAEAPRMRTTRSSCARSSSLRIRYGPLPSDGGAGEVGK